MTTPAPRTQAAYLRRGIEVAALISQRPRTVTEIAEELAVERRLVQRLLASLRGAGLEIETAVDWRDRRYSLKVVPTWLAKAARALAA